MRLINGVRETPSCRLNIWPILEFLNERDAMLIKHSQAEDSPLVLQILVIEEQDVNRFQPNPCKGKNACDVA